MSEKLAPLTKKIKLKYIYPEGLESKFTNHITIQNQKDCFTLSFFETIVPPILGDTEEERKNAFSKLEVAEARCLARFILTPEKMTDVVKALEENLKKHNEVFKKQGKTKE